MDTYLWRFAYCYRNHPLILPYWRETEICSIRDDGELKIQNKAQCHSHRPIPNDWRYFRPTLVFAVGFPYIRTLLQESTVFQRLPLKASAFISPRSTLGLYKSTCFSPPPLFQLLAAKKSRRIWQAWGLFDTIKTWELPTPHFKSFHLPRTFQRQSNEMLHIFFTELRTTVNIFFVCSSLWFLHFNWSISP